MGQQPENTKPVEASPSPSPLYESWRLDSPMIYLFGGLGVMLVLIMVTLLMLACSLWRLQSESSAGGVNSQKTALKACNEVNNVIPKIAVIMAGDELPTYLAAPAHVTGRSGGTTTL